jgi:molecular chaperone IbpA
MSTAFDLSPLFRSSVCFDRMLNTLENASRVATLDGWPPYDIVKAGDDDYRIEMAVAGFTEDELTITQERNMLTVAGQKSGEDQSAQYLHRGIAARTFQRRFELADYVKVVDASLVNGLLTINLQREIPDEMKPRRIAIATSDNMARVNVGQAEPERLAA